MLNMIKKILAVFITFNLAFSPVYAQVTPDGSTNTSVGLSELNTPVVNIAAPNQKGLSHNKFTDYNVGQDNLILNNAADINAMSNLGGYVGVNPNFNGKAANVILNEVTSTRPTNINGYTEVAGKAADLIIANPNGINIAGAGFINTPRVTMVTGSSDITPAGDLAGFNLSKTGSIQISGADINGKNNVGLVTENGTPLYLASRHIESTADIYAGSIDILLGNDTFDYVKKNVTSVSDAAPKPWEYSLDASYLGSMYAGLITIIGTEEGFGVKAHSNLISDLGGINLENNGNINFGKINAKGGFYATGADITGQEIYGGGDIFLKGENINYESITASGALSITAGATVSQAKAAQAGGDINITAQELAVAPAAGDDDVMLSYGNINIEAAALNNKGEIAAFKNLTLKTNTLNNEGLLLANNNLNILGGDVNNKASSSIFAGNDLTIKTDGSINNYLGSIYGLNNVLVGGLSGQRSKALTNEGGLIESRNGNITISAKEIINKSIDNCDPSAETCHTTTYAYNGLHIDKGQLPGISYTATAVSDLEAKYIGIILGARDVTLDAENIYNYSSTISAGETLKITADDKLLNDNTSYTVEVDDVTQKFIGVWNNRVPIAGNGFLNRGIFTEFTVEGLDSYAYLLFPASSRGDYLEGMEEGFALLYPVDAHKYDAVYDPTDQYVKIKRIPNPDGSKTPYYTVVDDPNLIDISCWVYARGFRCHENYKGAASHEEIIKSQTAGVLKGKNVDIQANLIGNGMLNPDDIDIPWGQLPLNPKIEDAANTGAVDPLSLVDFSQSGLFKAAPPDSDYLFTSASRFINPESYTGFDYFFGQTGIPHESHTTKIIGDAYFEQQLVEKAILQLTGTRYLYEHDGAPLSSNEQMARLYDNALNAYTALGLQLGKPLTQEQIDNLQDNIIWYVEQEVNGTKVYVPTLYLASSSRGDLLDSSAPSILGDTVSLQGGNLYNSGQIKGGDVGINIVSDVVNLSGTIHASESLDIWAGGNITNETKKNSVSHTLNGGKFQSDTLGQTAAITSGSNAKIEAGGDIKNTSAYIGATGALDIAAGGNIDIDAHKLTNGAWIKNFEKSSQTHIGSLIEGGSNINIAAGGDLTLKGSAVGAQGDINLSGENVNILSNIDTTHYWSYSEKKGSFGRKKISEDRLDTATHIGSEVVAGGKLNVNAGKDITVLASALTTKQGDMVLDAADNINIFAGVNEESSLTRREKRGAFGLSGKKDIVYDNVKTLEAASAFSGNNITLKSGSDTTILAGDVGAAGDGNIQTGGDFNLLAGIESQYHYEYHWEKKFNFDDTLTNVATQMFKGNILVDTFNQLEKTRKGVEAAFDTGRYEYFSLDIGTIKESVTERYQENIKQSNLTVGGSLNINTDNNTNIVSSNILADDITINSSDINIMDIQAQSYERSSSSSTGFNISAGVNVPFYDVIKSASDSYKKAEKVEDNIETVYDNNSNPQIRDKEQGYINIGVNTLDFINSFSGLGNSMKALKKPDGKYKSPSEAISEMELLYGRIDADIEKSHSYNSQSISVGSSIESVGDIAFNSAKDINQKGSVVYSDSGDISYNAGGDINITAGENLFTSSSAQDTYHMGGQFNINPLNLTSWSLDLEYNQQLTDNTLFEKLHNNSLILAENGNVSLNSGADILVKGANIHGDSVDVTAENLQVESLQDIGNSSVRSEGWGANITIGTSGLGVGGSYNYSKSGGDSAWVNQQTSISSTNEMELNIADTTTVKGGVIGSESGQLTLKTGNLEFEDIYDYSDSKSTSYNVGANAGKAPHGNINPNSVSGGLSLSGYEAEQTTKATIGEGQISIAGQQATQEQLEGLNRDMESTQEITKDIITGGLDVDLTLSYKWFSDFEGQLDNIAYVGTESYQVVTENIVKVYENLTYDEKQIIEDFKTGKETDLNKLEKAMKKLNEEDRHLLAADMASDEVSNKAFEEIKNSFDLARGDGGTDAEAEAIRREQAENFKNAYEEYSRTHPNITQAEFLEIKTKEIEDKVVNAEQLAKAYKIYEDKYRDASLSSSERDIAYHMALAIEGRLDTILAEGAALHTMLGVTPAFRQIFGNDVAGEFNGMSEHQDYKDIKIAWPASTASGIIRDLQKLGLITPSVPVEGQALPPDNPMAYNNKEGSIRVDPAQVKNDTFETVAELLIHEKLHKLLKDWLADPAVVSKYGQTQNYRILKASVALSSFNYIKNNSYKYLAEEHVVRSATENIGNKVIKQRSSR